jgi:hypothetical protein
MLNEQRPAPRIVAIGTHKCKHCGKWIIAGKDEQELDYTTRDWIHPRCLFRRQRFARLLRGELATR